MPQRSSTSRSEVRRRDRHKVYAAADPRQGDEVDEGVPFPTASTQEGLPRSTSPGEAFSRNESERRCVSNLCSSGDRVGVRADGRKGCHAAAAAGGGAGGGEKTTLGGVGPGAEPPVAVASHAFAHQDRNSEILLSDHGTEGGTERARLGLPLLGDQGLGNDSPGEDGGTCRSLGGVGTSERSPRCRHSGKDESVDSRPGSTNTNNEEEAETLPDSFNLSDEFGPEGASTGRNHHDDEGYGDRQRNKCGDSVFSGRSGGSGRSRREKRRGRPAPERYLMTSQRDDDDDDDDDDSSSGRCESRREKKELTPASASDSSEWTSSSRERRRSQLEMPPPQRVLIGRHTKRSSRIAPCDMAGGRSSADSERTRRRLRASRMNGSRYRSPPSRWQSRGAEERRNPSRRRRRGGRRRSRDSRRVVLTETGSISGEANYGVETEIARLRRENESLKQHSGRRTRYGIFNVYLTPSNFLSCLSPQTL